MRELGDTVEMACLDKEVSRVVCGRRGEGRTGGVGSEECMDEASICNA